MVYGLNVGGDTDGDLLEYQLDYRAYRQITRRALIAWRLTARINAGDRETFTGLGGINQLRGYDYRDFYGSRLAWTNFELRFPLVDELRFPFGPIRNIRGFLFADAGAAWLADDAWFDPETRSVRANLDGLGGGSLVPFKAWDSENNRLQDLRGAYGMGVQFFFLGGLQFNWTWSHRLPYTRFVDQNPNPFVVDLVKEKGDSAGWRSDFYIVFDW
jgi:outer membrane protein assembly factor BamA